MIAKNIYEETKAHVQAHEGKGKIEFCRLFTQEDFQTKCDFVDYAKLPPNTSIGLHKHGDNEEMYFVLAGTGLMRVDGEEFRVSKGDIIPNKIGGSHGLQNDGGESLEILVFQVSL